MMDTGVKLFLKRWILCTIACVAATVALFAARSEGAPAVAPTTQPAAPVRTFGATDLALQMNGATGEMARWLKAYDVPAKPFQYTMQLIEDADGIQVYRLVFASPFHSPFPENNVVPAEFYLPKKHDGKIPAAVVLDIMYGNAVVPRGMARGLAAQGVAALYMPMAYYNTRRPPRHAHVNWLEADPTRAVDPPRQTVMDIRRAKAILAARPEVDAKRIGITGVSLGGIMTALAAGVDGEFDRVVPILAGGDLATLIFHTRETRRVCEAFQARGYDRAKVAELMAPVEPTHFAARIDPKTCLMINGDHDEVIPKACTLDLWKAAEKPTLLWLPSGHYSAAWYLPTIKQTTIDFLKGEDVKALDF